MRSRCTDLGMTATPPLKVPAQHHLRRGLAKPAGYVRQHGVGERPLQPLGERRPSLGLYTQLTHYGKFPFPLIMDVQFSWFTIGSTSKL